MTLYQNYLTEEELQQLISEVEAEELIAAPPDLKENILNTVSGKNDNPTVDFRKYKRREFAGYCFRVCVSVAAAVAIIFLIPYFPGFGMEKDDTQQSDKPDIMYEQDMFGFNQEDRDYPTKEEVLNETNILERLFRIPNLLDKTTDA